jgi:hypothetical protein
MEKSQRPAVIWEGIDYPHLEPGLREVYVAEIQGPEWVRSYRRWSIRIECCTVDEPGTVSAFFNLGKEKSPSLGRSRQSKIYKFVTMALGRAPEVHERIEFEAFIGKHFFVRIEDCHLNSRGEKKLDGEVYSHITEFVRLVTP